MADSCATSRWSDLPGDLLGCILRLLELPESIAVAAVCTPWRSAATAAGVPRSSTPWLMYWSHLSVKEREDKSRLRRRWRSSEFSSFLDTRKIYEVSSPQGRSLAWVGSSHGWLVAADEHSSLLLYNPFTFATIPLPPVTGFDCAEAVYDSEGSIVEHLFGEHKCRYNVNGIGSWFYQKVVLSCAPSRGGDFTAMIVHYDANQVSFARAGEDCWRLASTIPLGSKDRYADCIFHKGRFYALTMSGIIEMWELDGSCQPTKSVIFPKGDKKYWKVFLRFLVSTPWGDLMQIRFTRTSEKPRRIKVQVRKVDTVKSRLVRLKSVRATFKEHAVFVGQNHSTCLPIHNFPELRPNCVYFTESWLEHREVWGYRSESRGGVGIYNFQNQMFEDAFSYPKRECPAYLVPHDVWITPNL